MVSGLKISVLQHTLTHCQYDSLLIILVSEKIPKLSRRQPIRTHQQTMIQVMAQLYNDYFSRIIMPRRSTLTKPWPLFHSFSTERWIHQAMNLNIHVLPRARNDWPLWTSLSESKKRLMVTMTESGTGLCWLQHEFHDHRPDIPPPSRRKGRRASQWNFRKLSFEHLTSCGHSHENPKFLYVYMIIWHICVYDLGRCKEIPIHQTVRSLQRPCHASIVPRRHPPCKTTGCGVFHVSWDHHFKSAWLLVAWMIGKIHTQNELKVLWHSSWLELNMTWPEKRR